MNMHIPSLDGIRAVAVLLVFLAHSGLAHWVPGGLGVTVFFFLSGYLITTLLRVELEKTGTINLRHFYLRRIFRIWPAFYLTFFFGIALTLTGFLPGSLQWNAVLAQALHIANYYSVFVNDAGTAVGSAVFWSLAVEEHFYLLFPCAYLLMRRRLNTGLGQLLLILLLCLCTLAWRLVLVTQFQAPQGRTYFATDTRFDSLLFGCALAVWHNPVLDEPLASTRALKYYFLPASVILLAFTLAIRNPVFRETLRYSLQGIALFSLFTAAILLPRWWLFAPLNTPWARALGRISYPFYLVHLTVTEWVMGTFSSAPVFMKDILAFAASVAIATVIYHYVETPFTAIRKRLSAH